MRNSIDKMGDSTSESDITVRDIKKQMKKKKGDGTPRSSTRNILSKKEDLNRRGMNKRKRILR